MQFTIQFSASTADELRTLMAEFARFAQDSNLPLGAVAGNADGTAGAVEVAAPKRGRPRKTDAAEATTPAPTIAQEVQDEDIHHAAATATATAPTATPPVETTVAPTEAADPSPAPVSDMTPKEARDKAIKLAQAYFTSNPNALPMIQKIQQKFGIKMFSECPEERAHELLADVMLLTNGTPAQTSA